MLRRLAIQTLLLGAALGGIIQPDRVAFATAGIAEWEVSTPGGNLISHIDPLKERYGTCLRKADDQPGLVRDDPARIYVDHLEWWQFYRHHVTGLGRRGAFLFDESTAHTKYFTSEQELLGEIKRRNLGKPVSERRTPADGWNEAWLPVIRERCRQLTTQTRADAASSEADKEAIRKYCAQVR